MPFINADYDEVKQFFSTNEVDNPTIDDENNNVDDDSVSTVDLDDEPKIPVHLRGIWSLKSLNNMSIMMSFNNAEFDEKNRRLLVKLYEPGNWLFREENFLNKHIMKLVKYTYQFDFDEEYKNAEININLGSLPIRFPKSISHWTLHFEDGKAIRKTSIFGSEHEYESTKIENAEDMNGIDVESFFYC